MFLTFYFKFTLKHSNASFTSKWQTIYFQEEFFSFNTGKNSLREWKEFKEARKSITHSKDNCILIQGTSNRLMIYKEYLFHLTSLYTHLCTSF